MTGRHWGLKRKLWAGYRAPSRHPCSLCSQSYFCLLDFPGLCNVHHIFHCWVWYRTLSLLCAHAMRVFDVWASSSPPGRNFILVAPSIGKLAREEKSHTQSLTHPTYLMCREPKLLLRNIQILEFILIKSINRSENNTLHSFTVHKCRTKSVPYEQRNILTMQQWIELKVH